MPRQAKASCHGMETSAALGSTRCALASFPARFSSLSEKSEAGKKVSLRIGGSCDVQYLVSGSCRRRLTCSVVTRIPKEKVDVIKSSYRNWLSGSGPATALYAA